MSKAEVGKSIWGVAAEKQGEREKRQVRGGASSGLQLLSHTLRFFVYKITPFNVVVSQVPFSCDFQQNKRRK